MPLKQDAEIEVTAFEWVPPGAQGLVKDLRVRWALEEAGLDYRVRLIGGDQIDERLLGQRLKRVVGLTLDADRRDGLLGQRLPTQ